MFLLVLNLLLLLSYNANAEYFVPQPFQNPISPDGYVYNVPNPVSNDGGYAYPKPETQLPICEPRDPVVVDCTDSPLDSSCQIVATNENGTCVKEADCSTAESIMNYLTPPFCGYYGETRLICCPLPEDENRAGGRPRTNNERETLRNVAVPQGGGPTSEEMCKKFHGDVGKAKRETIELPEERFKRDTVNPPFYFDPSHINTFAADQYLPPTIPPPKRTCSRITTTTPAPETTTTESGGFGGGQGFGTITEPGKYPYMAAIGFPNGDGVLNFACGGFLADPCYVITAAHCLAEPAPTHVRLGGVNLRDKTIQGTDLRIDPNGKIAYPNYRYLEQYNDIAVLRLATCAPASIRPACLWTEQFIPYPTLTALGYGETERGMPSDDLREIEVNVYENSHCQRVYGSTKSDRRKRGIVVEHLCAGRPLEDRDGFFYDSCKGDSGGPIGAPRERTYSRTPVPYVMGVTQFGRGCGEASAGVYARTSSHIGWLESVIWPNGGNNQ